MAMMTVDGRFQSNDWLTVAMPGPEKSRTVKRRNDQHQ
jgi:hypothetical protein